MVMVTILSITIDAPLRDPANPNVTPNPAKAPWYFLGLQEVAALLPAYYGWCPNARTDAPRIDGAALRGPQSQPSLY